MTVSEWIKEIKETHHDYLKREMPRLRILIEEKAGKEGGEGWRSLLEPFLELKHELEIHLAKEEMMVFPSFEHLEYCYKNHQTPDLSRHDIRESMEQMEYEHDATHQYLEQIKNCMLKIGPGPDSGREILERLERLEKDLEEHIEKEETGLFPEARFFYSELTKGLIREE